MIWAVIIAGTLWSKGYQPQSTRIFTDEEMIRIAVNRSMQRMQADPPKVIRVPSGDGSTYEWFAPAFVVPYRDVDHFLEENSKSFQIRQESGERQVFISGKVFYRDKSGQLHLNETGILDGQYFPGSIRYLP